MELSHMQKLLLAQLMEGPKKFYGNDPRKDIDSLTYLGLAKHECLNLSDTEYTITEKGQGISRTGLAARCRV
jgi:hypothetical protein